MINALNEQRLQTNQARAVASRLSDQLQDVGGRLRGSKGAMAEAWEALEGTTLNSLIVYCLLLPLGKRSKAQFLPYPLPWPLS